MADITEDLKKAITEALDGSLKKFLEDNQDAKAFVEDRAKRLAQLGVKYAQSKSEQDRKDVMELIGVVKLSIENELSSVAVNASIESRAAFASVMRTAMQVLIKVLPAIVAAV